MALFRRRREETGSVRTPGPFSAEEETAIEGLWRLTALPRAEFEATYGGLLARAWRYGTGARWRGARADALAAATAALRARQARIVPRFAAAEDAARLTEVMSFALAAAVVAERLGLAASTARARAWRPWAGGPPADAEFDEDGQASRSFGALLLPHLLGSEGGQWVCQETEALRELAAYFGQGRSELREIAEDAAGRIEASIGTSSEGAAEAPRDAKAPETAENASDPAEDEALRSSETEIRGQSTAPCATEARETRQNGPGDVGKGERQAGAGETVPAAMPRRIGTGARGWRWFNWLRNGYAEGMIEAGGAGWLHNVEGDAFVVDPDGFEAYIEAEELDYEVRTVKNQVLRLKQHRVRSKPEGGVASSFGVEFPDGHGRLGMLFRGELIWEDRAPPVDGDAKLRQRGRR